MKNNRPGTFAVAEALRGMVWPMLLLLAACGGSGDSGTSGTGGTSPAQHTINLYPSESATDSNRLFVFVTALGSTPVRMPLAFDTGSAGITLYAPDILPASIVTSEGFIFAPGESSLNYGGVTVLDQPGQRRYGGSRGRTEVGNLGFATVTFGDDAGTATTAVMPVFLYYQIVDNDSGALVPVPTQRGWFGVHDGANLIDEGTTAPPEGFPACAPSTSGSCFVASVLKYLAYAHGANAGFRLDPFPLQSCDIATQGSCAPAPMLTIGLTSAEEAGFSVADLPCPPANYTGPGVIAGFEVCQAGIADAVITVAGTMPGILSGDSVLFDSGTPYMLFNVPPGVSFPLVVAQGTPVLIATPAGFDYSFNAGAPYGTGSVAPDAVSVVANASSTQSIVGVGYFATHAFFIDFTTHTEGGK